MKFRRQFILKIKERRGAVSIIVAIMVFFVLIGLSALAIDVGYLYATKNELQNIADGAALAAAGVLGKQLSKGELVVTDIKDAAIKIGVGNQAGGKANIDIKRGEVEIGRWKDPDLDNPNGLSPTEDSPNAVRVIARRDGLANNSVRTFFGGIFGVDSVGVNADATAALLPPLQMEPIPVGISRYWFDKSHWPEGKFCEQDIKFHPTGNLEGCAGWHNYYDPDNPEKSNANARKLRETLDGLRDGTFEIPKTIVGKTKYAFIGGDVASVFTKHGQELSPIEALYDSKKGNCEDQDPDKWCAAVVVYDKDDCSNPNKRITIVGFAPVVITSILGPPQKTIEGRVLCDKVVWAQGESGEYYGYLTGIPRLVE